MPPRSPSRPPWSLLAEVGLRSLGAPPQASSALRLRLAWIVYQDPLGNLVVVDPERPRPLGAASGAPRPPTIYFAATDEEFEAVAEATLGTLERNLTVGRRQMALLDRIRAIRDLLSGRPRPLSKVA